MLQAGLDSWAGPVAGLVAGQASALKPYCGDDDDEDDARLVAGQASAVKPYCGDDDDDDDDDALVLVSRLVAVPWLWPSLLM